MKRLLSLLFCFALAFALYAQPQSDRKVDDSGNLLYQYCRSVSKNPENRSEVLVSFVFINGKNQMALSYRQEHFDSKIRWITTAGAHVKNEEFVDALTVNLAPNDSVVWTFAIEKGARDKSGVTVETAALLLMDDSFKVQKFYFDEKKAK